MSGERKNEKEMLHSVKNARLSRYNPLRFVRRKEKKKVPELSFERFLGQRIHQVTRSLCLSLSFIPPIFSVNRIGLERDEREREYPPIFPPSLSTSIKGLSRLHLSPGWFVRHTRGHDMHVLYFSSGIYLLPSPEGCVCVHFVVYAGWDESHLSPSLFPSHAVVKPMLFGI